MEKKVLSAHAFHLLDDQDQVRAAWMTDASGRPGFALYDEGGVPRLLLMLGEGERPSMNLLDPEGRLLATLSISAEQQPSITLSDGQSPKLTLAIQEQKPTIILSNEQPDLVLQIDEKHQPSIQLSQEGKSLTLQGQSLAIQQGGKIRARLALDGTSPTLTYYDQKGQERLVSGLDEQENGETLSYTEEDHLLWRVNRP